MTTEENWYCARLDVPVPHVEDYVADNKIKLLELMVLALLERGEPMTMEAVADRLLAAGVRVPTGDVLLSLKKAWHGLKPLYRDNQGRMCLDVQAPELRWLLRKRGLSNQANRPTPLPPLPPEPEVLPDDVPLTEREIRAGTRKVVLHVFPEDERPAAAALLDIGARTIRSFVGDEELDELRSDVNQCDWIAALRVRQTCESLSIEDPDRFRLIDLSPSRKTRQLNRQGRKLQITPELLISATTRISRPLGDPAKMADYLSTGQLGKLRRRLESDVKSLAAYFQYGLLHGCVRLRWGFIDDTLPAEWDWENPNILYAVLRRSMDENRPVELVWGSAPGWNEPWARARRVMVRSLDFHMVEVDDGNERWDLPRYDIQAVRIVDE